MTSLPPIILETIFLPNTFLHPSTIKMFDLEFAQLRSQHSNLKTEHRILKEDHEILQSKYDALFASHKQLVEVQPEVATKQRLVQTIQALEAQHHTTSRAIRQVRREYDQLHEHSKKVKEDLTEQEQAMDEALDQIDTLKATVSELLEHRRAAGY